MWIIIYCILSRPRSHVFLYSPNPLPAMSLYWLRYCSLYDTTCINVYRPSEMTEFSAMVYPISKAALTATASARTIELAKPRKPRGGSDKWIDAAPCIHRLLYIISYIRCVEKKFAQSAVRAMANITFERDTIINNTWLLCNVWPTVQHTCYERKTLTGRFNQCDKFSYLAWKCHGNFVQFLGRRRPIHSCRRTYRFYLDSIFFFFFFLGFTPGTVRKNLPFSTSNFLCFMRFRDGDWCALPAGFIWPWRLSTFFSSAWCISDASVHCVIFCC